MSCLFFHSDKVVSYEDASKADTEKYGQYFRTMLEEGIYLAPSQFEAAFLSAVHKEEEIEKTIKANYKALKKVYGK